MRISQARGLTHYPDSPAEATVSQTAEMAVHSPGGMRVTELRNSLGVFGSRGTVHGPSPPARTDGVSPTMRVPHPRDKVHNLHYQDGQADGKPEYGEARTGTRK